MHLACSVPTGLSTQLQCWKVVGVEAPAVLQVPETMESAWPEAQQWRQVLLAVTVATSLLPLDPRLGTTAALQARVAAVQHRTQRLTCRAARAGASGFG